MNSYVLIKVESKTRLFLKRITNLNILYSNFNKQKDTIYLKISYDDYLKIKKYEKIYCISVVKWCGPAMLKTKYKKHKHPIYAFILSILIIFLLSKIIFNVSIIHDRKNIRDIIDNELIMEGVAPLKLSPSYEKIQYVKEKILTKYKNKIEWIEINVKGSTIVVKVLERKLNKNKKDESPRNLIAKKHGIIKKITSAKGDVLKKVNDYVLKGETVITGNIIKDETVKGQVHATGKVYAEVWYNVKVSYPLRHKETVYLDDSSLNIDVKLLNHNYKFLNNYRALNKKKALLYDRMNFLNISIQKERKVKVINQKLNLEQAKVKALNEAINKISSNLSKDEYIMSKKTLNFYNNGSKIVVDIFFKVYEDITDYENIPVVSNN